MVSPTKLPGMVILTMGPAEQSMPSLRLSPAAMIGPFRICRGMSFLRWTGLRVPGERILAGAVVRVDGVGRSDLRPRRLILIGVFLPDVEQPRHRALQAVIDAAQR